MDEREVREREIYAEFLADTPIGGDENELDRLMQVDGWLNRRDVVAVIVGGEADSVAGALEDIRWRGEFLRDVQADIDQL